jgi:hypothetical protein
MHRSAPNRRGRVRELSVGIAGYRTVPFDEGRVHVDGCDRISFARHCAAGEGRGAPGGLWGPNPAIMKVVEAVSWA